MRIGDTLRIRWACLAIWLVATTPLSAQMPFGEFEEYDLMMYERPNLSQKVEVRTEFRTGLTELWGRALDRPDAELQRLVIDTLALARRRGVEGVDELKPKLIDLAKSPDQPLDVARSLAQTLVAFDAKDQVDLLADMATAYGTPIAGIVEPAFAKWQAQQLEDVWLERIAAGSAGTRMTILAIEGLAAIHSQQASEPLESLVLSPATPKPIRLSAARALGDLHESGLVQTARDLALQESQPAWMTPILAAQVLRRHSDPDTVDVLTGLLANSSSTVQSEVLEQLYRIDFKLIDPFREQLLGSPDANVRRWCLKALVDTKQADRMELVCSLLDDVNPLIRREASEALVALAQNTDLRGPIIEHSSSMLHQDSWRGCEQACVVLTQLDHNPSAQRMVELLGHPRGDVQVAAAWGLSKLRVKELLPAMLDHAQSIYEGFKAKQLSVVTRGAQLHLAHLFIAFGDQGYRPAEGLMREYLPKNLDLGLESRVAAVWSVGLFYEGNPDPEVVSIFVGRLGDVGEFPEMEDVRDMSGVSLGRMKAESALPDLRKYASLGLPGCYWAIEQMTGEKPPVPEPSVVLIDDWFLSTLGNEGE